MAVSPAWAEGELVMKVGGLDEFPGSPTRLLMLSVILVPVPSLNSKSARVVVAAEASTLLSEKVAIARRLGPKSFKRCVFIVRTWLVNEWRLSLTSLPGMLEQRPGA